LGDSIGTSKDTGLSGPAAAHYWLSLPVAFATGALAVVVARLVRAMVSTGALAGTDATEMMLVDLALALVIAFVCTAVLVARSQSAALAQILGVMAMLAVMHDFVHAAPKLWTVAFSRDWVLTVLTTTEPASVLVKGVSYRL
jgi:hypothetical protein